MTEQSLISLIFVLCQSNTKHIQDSAIRKEMTISCFEKNVNCAIIKEGKIVKEREFIEKCLK